MPAFCLAANVDELLERESDNTTCATPIYQKALDTTVDMLAIGPDGQEQKPESATGSEIDTWIHTTFAIPTVITNVLNCPEINNKDDDSTIVFDTINYTFPNGFIQNASPEIRDLIQQCLEVNPSSRISAKKALNHPFFDLYETKEFFIHVTESFLNKTINNIKKYEIKNSLQELTFSYLVHNYPNQEVLDVHQYN